MQYISELGTNTNLFLFFFCVGVGGEWCSNEEAGATQRG